MIKEIAKLPDISFIGDITLDDIKAKLVSDYQEKYQELTQQAVVLKEGEPITLMLYACAVQFMQMYECVDQAGKMNFLKYAYGDFLDNLGALKGVSRQDEAAAACMVRFTLSALRPGVIAIPEGTRVTTQAADIYFATDEYAEIPSGQYSVDVRCTAMTTGTKGNGYGIGDLSVLVDPVPYVDSVTNLAITSGGLTREDDESLADRIYLAPANYSVAGPQAAYEYFVKEAYPGVADVAVTSPDANLIDIRVIGEDGQAISADTCAYIQDYLTNEQIKPMGDVVTVGSPTSQIYNISVTYYINRSDAASVASIQQAVDNAVTEYANWQAGKIGRDIEPGKLIEYIMAAGAKRVSVSSPAYQTVDAGKIAKLGTRSVIYGGVEDD